MWSCWNHDGGFGDRPGWRSNAPTTLCALDTLQTLGALDAPPPADRPTVSVPVLSLSSNLQGTPCCWKGTAPAAPPTPSNWPAGCGSTCGAPERPRWWIARAQQLADHQSVPVTFFVANEEYGTWVHVPGLGTYSHTSDILAPADGDLGTSLARTETVAWQQYRERRLPPLQAARGRLIWQFGENEELVRLFLDDSLAVAATRPSARFISAIPTSPIASPSSTATAARFPLSPCRMPTAMSRGGLPT